MKKLNTTMNLSTNQPMNINFGLFAPFKNNIAKDDRKEAYSTRALEQLEIFKIENNIVE